MWKGTLATLKPKPTSSSAAPPSTAPGRAGRAPRARSRSRAAWAMRASEVLPADAVEQRHAVEEEGGGEGAGDEVLERRLLALRAVAVQAGQRVERDGHDLEGHEERDQLEAGDEAQHPHEREEQQRVVLAAVDAGGRAGRTARAAPPRCRWRGSGPWKNSEKSSAATLLAGEHRCRGRRRQRSQHRRQRRRPGRPATGPRTGARPPLRGEGLRQQHDEAGDGDDRAPGRAGGGRGGRRHVRPPPRARRRARPPAPPVAPPAGAARVACGDEASAPTGSMGRVKSGLATPMNEGQHDQRHQHRALARGEVGQRARSSGS